MIVLPSAAKSLNAVTTTPAPSKIASASSVTNVTSMLSSASIPALATVSPPTVMSAIIPLKSAMKAGFGSSYSSTSSVNVKLPLRSKDPSSTTTAAV